LIQIKKLQVYFFSKEIFLYQIPAALKTKAEKANWMEQNGCESQAERFMEK
jgi:hypothetical protein